MSDKTEQPTPKRLRESREKGDVCKSQDVPSALTVLALSVYIVVMGGHLLESLLAMMELPMKLLSTPYAEAAPRAAEATFHIAVSIVAPLVGLVMAVALVANLGQVGILFAFKGAMPKLENVSPSKWFQKVFSMKNLVEFLKNIIKVTVLGVTVWVVMRDHLPTLFAIQRGTIWTMWEVLGMAVKDLLLMAAGVFCVIAAGWLLWGCYGKKRRKLWLSLLSALLLTARWFLLNAPLWYGLVLLLGLPAGFASLAPLKGRGRFFWLLPLILDLTGLALCAAFPASFFLHLHTALCSATLPLYVGWLSGPSFSPKENAAKETEPCPPET